MSTTSREPRLGLRANLAQFSLLVAVNALAMSIYLWHMAAALILVIAVNGGI